jgi:hypothetical protein
VRFSCAASYGGENIITKSHSTLGNIDISTFTVEIDEVVLKILYNLNGMLFPNLL